MSRQGRHFRRAGASFQGTLSNWIAQIVHSRIAERERLKVSNRAWDLFINDAMSHGIIEGLVTEVVNTGLTPQPHPMASWLKKDANWQKEYQQAAYDLFEIWGLDCRNWCDATGRCNIYMLQALALFQWKLEGIGVFQIVMDKNPSRPLSLSILPIDPGRLVTPTNINEDVYDGLELGKNGEIKASWILRPDKPHSVYCAKADDCIRIDAVNKKTGLANMLFVCDVRNVSEYRQDSILGSMIKEIKDSNDFVDAALVKSLIQNLWTLFVESEMGAGFQDKKNTTWQDRIQEMEKGTMIFGYPGEKAHFLNSNAPGPNYDMMNQSIIGRLGMSTGRGPENVSRSYKSSYSASRASIENASKFDDYDRMILANRFCQPINVLMQYEAALRGFLPVTSIKDFIANQYAYTRTDWMPPKLRPIDHAKESKADTERLNNHTKTYSDIYGERSENWRAKLRQAAIEIAYIEELNEEFNINMKIGNHSNMDSNQEENEENKENEENEGNEENEE